MTSSSLGVRTLTAQVLSAPTTFPTAGYGGSYYRKIAFQVPTYSSTANDHVSWGTIDAYVAVVINNFSTMGIAAGLAWATFIYVLALTPNRKRTSPFHTFLLLGVSFLLVHLMIDLISACIPGLSKYPAYIFLTHDTDSMIWPSEFRSIHATSSVADTASFICASICLWLQARGLLSGVRIRFRRVYLAVLSFLILESVLAFIAQVAYLVRLVQQLGKTPTVDQYEEFEKYETAYLSSYALSIGSYALVAMCSIVNILWRRPASVVKGNNAYASALNLVGLLCAQSFAVPFIFCILTFFKTQSGLVQPVIVLLPTVYLILPLGTLFMTICQNDTAFQRDNALQLQPSPAGVSPLRQKFLEQNRSNTLTEGVDQGTALQTPPRQRSAGGIDGEGTYQRVWNSPKSPVDRELDLIDALSTSTSVHENQPGHLDAVVIGDDGKHVTIAELHA